MRRPSPILAAAFALVTVSAAAATSAAAQAPATQAPAAHAARTVTAPAPRWQSVVYRLTLSRGSEVMPMRVVLDRVGATFDAVLLVSGSVSALASVEYDGAELRGEIQTSNGPGRLVLRESGETVTGTITVGRTVWTITGERSA
jgi:hypothetical protein